MKVFVYVDDDGHFRVYNIELRGEIWKLIYDKYGGNTYRFSDIRVNENLKNYSFDDFVGMSNEEYEDALKLYCTRGWCEIVNVIG